MLEASMHPLQNAFVTLTYADDPYCLEPQHLQNFLKRLRKRIAPQRLRFYAVGEYGEKNMRPHFHLAIFNFPSCRRAEPRLNCSCTNCRIISDTWGLGLITNDELTIERARYVARYVIKKLTRWDDPRLGNRTPEFSRMSLKPGIGFGVLEALSYVLLKYKLLTPEGDVPVTLRHGTIEWPLGRYLRKKLRKKLNLDERSPNVLSAENAYKSFQENAALQAMWAASLSDSENPSPKFHLLKAAKGRIDQIVSRHNLHSKKGPL